LQQYGSLFHSSPTASSVSSPVPHQHCLLLLTLHHRQSPASSFLQSFLLSFSYPSSVYFPQPNHWSLCTSCFCTWKRGSDMLSPYQLARLVPPEHLKSFDLGSSFRQN
jgi:hypothetical protein